MNEIKHHYHDLIEQQSRLYNVIELQKISIEALTEIGCGMNITVAQASGKQTLIYAILNKQAE